MLKGNSGGLAVFDGAASTRAVPLPNCQRRDLHRGSTTDYDP